MDSSEIADSNRPQQQTQPAGFALVPDILRVYDPMKDPYLARGTITLAKTVLGNCRGDAKWLAMQIPAKDLCSPDGSGLERIRH
eukprot:898397-Karenia_brevis.AAC.1